MAAISKAVNGSDRNFTQAKNKRRIQEAEKSIAQYLKDLEVADLRSPAQSTPHQVRLKERIALFTEQMQELQMIEAQVQAAVDTKNHMIVAHELTNVGHDRSSPAKINTNALQGNP